MRDLFELKKYARRHPTLGWGDKDGGFYIVPSPLQTQVDLRIIASRGMGWDHVSISLKKRTPVWREMEFIKRLFFEDDEVVMQLHVAVKDYINAMPFCLHLWKPHKETIPLPLKIMVAPE